MGHIVALVAAAFLFSGCASVYGLFGIKLPDKEADQKVVKEAYKKDDAAAIEKYCKNDDFKNKVHGSAQQLACKYKKRLAKKALTAEIDAAKCDTLLAVWKEKRSGLKSKEAEVGTKVAVRLAKCGEYAYVFRHMINWGYDKPDAYGRQMLTQMDEAGLPVEAEFLKWLSTHKASPFPLPGPRANHLGQMTLTHYSRWRLEKGDVDCSLYYKPLSIFKTDAELGWVWFFLGEAKCEKSADTISQGLAHKKPVMRKFACMALGKIGNKTHLKKLNVLAKTDGTFKIVKKNKIFWVRDACLQAAGQIELR
jgi:hypothetical protein